MEHDTPNYYELLGVKARSSQEEINRAFELKKALCLQGRIGYKSGQNFKKYLIPVERTMVKDMDPETRQRMQIEKLESENAENTRVVRVNPSRIRFDQIKYWIGILDDGTQDLYQFLGHNPDDSLEDIMSTVYNKNEEFRASIDENRQRLTGECLVIFKSESSRAEYDRWLEYSDTANTLESIESICQKLAKAHKGRFDDVTWDILLDLCREKGFAEKESSSYLTGLFETNSWTRYDVNDKDPHSRPNLDDVVLCKNKQEQHPNYKYKKQGVLRLTCVKCHQPLVTYRTCDTCGRKIPDSDNFCDRCP